MLTQTINLFALDSNDYLVFKRIESAKSLGRLVNNAEYVYLCS
jgi:hypothetical protein